MVGKTLYFMDDLLLLMTSVVCKMYPAHITCFRVLSNSNHSEEINVEIFTATRNSISYECIVGFLLFSLSLLHD